MVYRDNHTDHVSTIDFPQNVRPTPCFSRTHRNILPGRHGITIAHHRWYLPEDLYLTFLISSTTIR